MGASFQGHMLVSSGGYAVGYRITEPVASQSWALTLRGPPSSPLQRKANHMLATWSTHLSLLDISLTISGAKHKL